MIDRLANWLLSSAPIGVRRRYDDAVEAIGVARTVHNPKVLLQMMPSVARGLLIKQGKLRAPVAMPARHSAFFDFEYRHEFPEMYDLYRRAVANQWNAETDLDWSIDVDPLNPETPVLARDFVPFEVFEERGFHLNAREKREFTHSVASWILSQFLHGEQGALYAAAQVTESVEWLDGKFYGSTQVMDEGRHVEVFFRYLETKLGKLYQVNDNLFVILDQLMTDSRWDMKFLGMQIMVEGLALGAFGLIYSSTGEPLLRELLRYVIQDEARHVHYGVLALRRHFAEELSERERREREDWCYRDRAPHAKPLPRPRGLRGMVRGPPQPNRVGRSLSASPLHAEIPDDHVQATRAESRVHRPPHASRATLLRAGGTHDLRGWKVRRRADARRALERPRMTMMAARELDLTNASSSRIVWLVRLTLRCSQIAFWLAVVCAALPFVCAARRSVRGGLGSSFAFLFRRLGATFIKIGQIAATRPDIFSHEATTPLTALQDRVAPFRFADVRRSLEEDFGRKLEEIFAKIEEQPVASASVAQVHRAILQDAELPPGLSSRVVAVKVRRPGIVRTVHLDRSILELVARILSFFTTYSLISPREAVRQFCRAVEEQLDFRIEAENNRAFRKNFEADSHVFFPTLVEHLCSDRVLTMEFVNGVKDGEILAVGSDPEFVARKGTEAIVQMIFQHGLVHADLHPGNVLFLPANRIAVFDLGLVGRLDENDRTRYAFFCYYIVSGMGVEVARWIAEQSEAKRVRDYAKYESDVVAHVAEFHDRPFEDVQLTGFLVGLYEIVRRHGVRFEATFTIANIALMVIEGIGRKIDPKLNVTRESRPYLESAIALAVAGPTATSEDAAALSQSTPTALAGGRYRVRRLLGEGVRKRVYLARDTRLDRDVAIAFIRTAGLDENGRAAVMAEARAVARLSDHPRIVPVHDSGEENGVPYIVSQYMAGGTLSGRLLRTTDHRMPIDDALRFVEQICQALEHAHAHGIVHRDVKPENVWLTEDGFAKLGDFGLARTLGRPEASLEGITVGTALYMSPEQALGRHLDARSDLYSLGASLYELLTGRPPFEGDSVADVISRHISANPESPSRRNPLIPPALDALVLKLLAKSPDNRFHTAASVREALREVLAKGSAVTDASEEADDEAADDASARFVGREAEIGRLRKSLEEALSGRGRLALVAGEPGIGKTRLVTQFASYAETRSARVFFARCHEGEAAPAFWPWVQIIRAWLQERDTARLESELGGGASFIAQIVPEIRERIPDLADPPAIEGDVARFRLFDAVATFLKRVAESQALVLVLDDLHWADKPSLLLLQFLARQMGGSRLLLIGTYRDVDVQHGHPLAEVLPSLRRERVFERVLLRGMSEDEVAALVTTLAGEEVPASFVRAVSSETEGNPFFIEETLRHLVEEKIVARERGRWTSAMSVEEMGLPEGIRDVIGRRLARLSDPCREALTVASAIGREFEARLLPAVAGVELDTILVLLDEAARARIVEQDRTHAGSYRFSHALVRETLYGEVRTGERVQLHRRIAEALETHHADDLEPHLPELAHHFLEAVPATDAGRAVRYAMLGAEHAARQMAFEEAAALYRRAIRVLALAERAEDGQHCELLLRLGQVEWDAGEWTRSKATIRQAIELSARVGTHEQLARAALAYSGRAVENTTGQVDHEQIAVLERAFAALPREDSALRALTLGRLAAALAFSPRRAECEALATEALAMARRVGDKRILALVLVANVWARWNPDGGDERLASLDEAIQLARELGDEGLSEMPRVLRYFALVSEGDQQAEEALADLQRTRQGLSAYVGWVADGCAAGAAMLQLPASEAARLVDKAAQAGREQNRVSLYAFATQRTRLLWQWGRIEEASKVFREVHSGLREFSHPYLGCASAFLYAEAGDVSGAKKAIDRFARNDFRALPRDAFWCACISLLASAVTTVGDVRSAEVLYGMLLPYASRVGVLFVHSIGAGSFYLGLLARALSRLDDAARHFEDALAMHERVPALLVLTQYQYGRLLLLRAAPGDRKRAISLLASAVEGARRLEMNRIADQALTAKLEAEGVEPGKVRSSIDLVTASIEARGSIDLRRATAPNGTVTLVFSDMEGFSEMTEKLGDAEAHRVMQTHHAIIRGELRAHGGSEIEVQGDGFLLAFPRATEALRYAITVQRLLAAYREEHPDRPIRVRMGIHTGEPIREGKRFFGKTVILASRISAHARGNEVLVSSLVHGLAEPSGEFDFDAGEEVALKGLSGSHRVFGLVWDPSVPARQPRVEAATVTAASALQADSVFRREGDYWTISYEGRSIRLRDAKGLQYVAALLRRPGEEIHAADLVANGTSHPAAAGVTELNVSAGLGDAGEVLDEKARTDYRQRLESLREELEDAREMNDAGRAERIEQEIEFITQELSSAYGLGGRARKVASSAERARKAVSSRVTDSLSRIRRENPDLAAHFQNAIHLGLFCSYEPEKPVRWSF